MAFLFISSWIILFIFAIRLMIRGWKINPPKDIDLNYNIEKRTVTKIPHPEMAEVKQGDELLVVRFDDPKKEMDPRFKLDSPELHNLDPLQQSLRDRIEELNEDDDDDDDGGIISRA